MLPYNGIYYNDQRITNCAYNNSMTYLFMMPLSFASVMWFNGTRRQHHIIWCFWNEWSLGQWNQSPITHKSRRINLWNLQNYQGIVFKCTFDSYLNWQSFPPKNELQYHARLNANKVMHCNKSTDNIKQTVQVEERKD